MTASAFQPGDAGHIEGFQWRVSRGQKADGDLVIDVNTDGWVRLKMAATLLLADFHYQVEDIVFPPGTGPQGGEYILSAIAEASRDKGWRAVAARIEQERQGGRRPTFKRYQPLPPWDGREEEGRYIATLRTAISYAMWQEGRGMNPRNFVECVRSTLPEPTQNANNPRLTLADIGNTVGV